jgi:hypothetical protein
MNSRGAVTVLFALAGLALCASLARIVLAYALPPQPWVEIGRLADFPPADEPYTITRDVYVFLVNDGQEILVLDPLNPAPGGVNVRWHTQEQAFVDPSRGSWFNVNGMPVRRAGVNSILENQGLRRYTLKVVNDLIYIAHNLSQAVKIAESHQP